MREHNKDSRSDPNLSSNEERDDVDNSDVFFESASLPRASNRSGYGYNTFERSSDDHERLRSQSVSLPYIACNSRTMKRSYSSHEAPDAICKPGKAKSTGNLNGTLQHSTGTDDSDEETDVPSDIYWCGFTKRQVKCGIALCLLSITDVMGYSIFSPFFPIVAEEKMLSEVQIGLIFAGFSMAGIFASIFTGTLLARVGAKFIIIAGLFWSAGSTICFGVLDKCPAEYFFVVCFVCRLLMGIGSASAFTALFAVIFQEFSNRALTVIGISESLCSIGGILGPLIGGALYDVGGYITPFAFLGTLELIVLVLAWILIPPVAVERHVNAVSPAWLLLNPHGLFSALFVIFSFTVNSFITASLSLFLIHSFGLSAFMVGVFMLIFSIFYGVSTPIWAYFAETKNCGPHLMTIGCFFSGLVLTFFGPADLWLQVFGWDKPQEWLVIVCTCILGALMGALVMPTFGEMVVAAKQMKIQDNELAEYGLVSGLWNTVFAVGDILGPTVGGVIITKTSFGNTLAIFGLAMAFIAILKAFHLIYIACNRKKATSREDLDAESGDQEETKRLLSPGNPSLQA